MGYKHLTKEQRYTIDALLQTPRSTEAKTCLDDLLCHHQEFLDAPANLGLCDLMLALQGETKGKRGFTKVIHW